MSDKLTMPVNTGLQATFKAYIPRLVAAFGVDQSVLPPLFADLSVGQKLVQAASPILSSPIFRGGFRMQDGSVVRQIGIAAELLESPNVTNGQDEVIGLVLKMIFFHPMLGEPRTLGVIIISADDVVVSMPGASLHQNDHAKSGIDQGMLSQLLAVLPADAAADMAKLFLGMIQSPNVPRNAPHFEVVEGVIQEVAPFATGGSQKALPAPDPEADYDLPFSPELTLVLPELTQMVDAALGVDPADATSLTTAFLALSADLQAKSEELTLRTLASILDTRDGLQFMLDNDGGKISAAALAIAMTNDAGDVVDVLILGMSNDVTMPAILAVSGLELIVGDLDGSSYDPQSFATFAKSSAVMSAAKAKANREMVIRALVAFQPLAEDDASAENLRRRALRLLKSSLIQ